jgi:hypothetical protein
MKTIWDVDEASKRAVQYALQSAVADALMHLTSAITWWAVGRREYIDELREEASITGRDFPSLVVARRLGIDYNDVLPDERWAAKHGLFAYLYSAPGDKIVDHGINDHYKGGVAAAKRSTHQTGDTMKKLIGISGLAGAGKSEAANILVRDHGWAAVSLAAPMKRAAAEWFGFTDQQMWGPSEFRNAPDPRIGGCTPRKVLQRLGTEMGRECYADVWVEYALRVANALLGDDGDPYRPFYSETEGLTYDRSSCEGGAKGVVVPDVRFENERNAIERAGGVVWRIVRPGAGLEGAAGAHISETELADDMFELKDIVVNDGTLVDLAAQIAFMLRRDGLVECDDECDDRNHPDRGGAFWE